MKLLRNRIPFLLLLVPRSTVTLPIIYLAPIVSLLIFLRQGYKISRKSLMLIFSFFLINALVISLTQAHFKNYILAMASYGSIFLLAVVSQKAPSEKDSLQWQKSLLFLAIAQGVIGVAQLFYNGFPLKLPYRDFTEDFFVGTLGTGGNNVVANILAVAVVLCLFKLDAGRSRKILFLLIFLVVCLLMTSSNMSLITMAASYAFICLKHVRMYFNIPTASSPKALYLKTRFRVRKRNAFQLSIGLICVLGFIGSGGYRYLSDTYHKWTYTLEMTDNARYMAIKNTLTQLPLDAPYQPLVGVGLGNYSSWAQMILSEDYIRVHVIGKHSSDESLLKIASQTDIAYENVLKYLSADLFRAETESIINQPFFSWQSLYAETGFVGLFLLFLLISPKLKSLKICEGEGQEVIVAKKTLIFYTVFLFVNGFIDNYFEYPWVTLPYLIGILTISYRKRTVGGVFKSIQ